MSDAATDHDAPGPGDGPIFVVGWWRSGTTFLWNLLRDDDRYTGYFEPLHPHLKLYLDHGGRERTDPTHLAVSGYWTEYAGLHYDVFAESWRPWFGRDRWVLDADDDAPDLRDYLQALIDHADRQPVLKTTRAALRAEWVRATFPEATIVHVARDPRCVWTSMVGRDTQSGSIPMERHALFQALIAIADELGVDEPGHLYRLLYRVWLQAYGSVEAVADATWWYDDAVYDPETWFQANLVEPGWLDTPPDVPVHAESLEPGLHPKSWYLDHEASVQADLGPVDREGDDERIRFLLEENRHLSDENERLIETLETLEDRYERLLARPWMRPIVRLYRRVRAAIGRPVD